MQTKGRFPAGHDDAIRIRQEASTALESLYHLENALDALPVRLTDETALAALRDLWRRWHYDTSRKINRAASARDLGAV